MRVRPIAGLTVAAASLAVFAPIAQGGSSIHKLSSCTDGYAFYAPGAGSLGEFRTGLLCLINEARGAEGLPALKPSAQLEKVAEAQSSKFLRTGGASHGASLSDISKRFAKVGYRAAAYNEAFDDLGEGATPYLFLAHMLDHDSIPCTEILDPRFREIGIGASTGSVGVDTLALEFGLRQGQSQPSTKTAPQDSCPHEIPPPVVTGMPVLPGQHAPTASGEVVTLRLKCAAREPCVLTSTLKLPDAHATAESGKVTIPAGKSQTISYTFAGEAVKAELAASEPQVTLDVDVTGPVAYTGTIGGPLTTE
jgi:uncharacterized protein YkwD